MNISHDLLRTTHEYGVCGALEQKSGLGENSKRCTFSGVSSSPLQEKHAHGSYSNPYLCRLQRYTRVFMESAGEL